MELNRIIYNLISEIQDYQDKGVLKTLTCKIIFFLQQSPCIQCTKVTSFHIPASAV